MAIKASKRKAEAVAEIKGDAVQLPAKRMSDEPIPKKVKWTNKQRVLVFASRGISHRDRHLMEDLKTLMPHHKSEAKMERSKTLSVVNEMCEMKNCNKAIMFEGRRRRDLYMWLSNVPAGPSCKFLVENIHTMGELKMTGNCLRGSRPLLSFDTNFTEKPHYQLLKELLTQIFGVPNHHPKSQPFFDHVYSFSILDNRIWFRNFQILSEDGALTEVGPRFVLNPAKLFSGSFGGDALWENPNYVSPAKFRQNIRLAAKNKYVNRLEQKVSAQVNKPEESYKLTPYDDIFKGDPFEKAKQIEETAQNGEPEKIANGATKKVKKMKKLKKSKVTNENADDTTVSPKKVKKLKKSKNAKEESSKKMNAKKGSPKKMKKVIGSKVGIKKGLKKKVN